MLTLLLFALAVGNGFAAVQPKGKPSKLDPDLARFIVEKRDLAKALVSKHKLTAPKVVWDYFDAAVIGDGNAITNHFAALTALSGRHGNAAAVVPTEIWPAIHETYGAYEQFQISNHELLKRFANEIVQSIPEGSVYFGGTDPGRFVVSAMTRHTDGKPFFTLTQNGLADGNYLSYLTELYGKKIKTLTTNDSQKAFGDYVADAKVRKKENRLKPDEDVRTVGDRIQVSGSAAVMAINERLVQLFMQHNRDKEIFMEESYVLESFYPHVVPHGLILKLHHQPLERLPRDLVQKDQQYWGDLCQQLVGNRLQMDTQALATWAEQRYTKGEPAGNIHYTSDEPTVQIFAKCRSAIAGVYAWRGKTDSEKGLLEDAEIAHKQAWGLAPFYTEIADRYSDFLLDSKRTNDAKIVLQMTLKLIPQLDLVPDTEHEQGVESLEKLKEKEKALSEK